MLVERRRSGLPAVPLLRIIAIWAFVSALIVIAGASLPILELRLDQEALRFAQPIAILGLTMFLAARIAWQLIGEREAVIACLTIALSLPILSQLEPARFDQTAWQFVLALAVLNGLLQRNPRVGGWIAGLSLAILMTLSVATLPLAGAFTFMAGAKWLRDRGERMWLVHMLQAQAIGLIAAYLTVNGISDFSIQCGSITIVHIAAFCWAAIIASSLARVGPIPNGALLGGFSFAVGGGLATLMIGAPACIIDPLAYASSVGTPPIWTSGVVVVLEIIALPLIGLWAALNLAARNAAWLRRWWFDYALLLAFALVLALLMPDFGGLAAAIAAAPIGWKLCKWLDRIAQIEVAMMRFAALVVLAFILLPSVLFELVSRLF